MPVIGQLSSGQPPPNPGDLLRGPLHQGMGEMGFVEGQNVMWEYRWADNHYDRLPALAADLVSRKVDLIVTTTGTLPARAAKNATSTIPIIFAQVGDPVGGGLVASLARPGGNVTGFSNITAELTPKRLELLCELVPQATVIALLVNPDNGGDWWPRFMQEAARVKRVQLPVLKARTEGELDMAFASLGELQAGGLVVTPDPFFNGRSEQLVALASRYAIPAISEPTFRYGRRPDELWHRLRRSLSPGRYFRGKDFEGRKASRSAGPAADDLRADRQSQDRKSSWSDRAPVDPRARRRGH